MIKHQFTILHCFVLGLAFLLAFPPGSLAEERILKYISHIQIHSDASMTVTETISVISEGDRIRRGIYRTFPLEYRDRYGSIVRTRFEMISATRNGAAENFYTTNEGGNIKIYLGQESVFLDPGEYTYKITYKTQRQLGFFPDFDELYWNVTGNDWDFAIDSAAAIIELPARARALNQAGYTGFRGDKGLDFSVTRDERGRIVFATTAPLLPQQGLTVAVSWPIGFVTRPTQSEKLNFIFRDNLNAFIMLIGFLILIGYYFNAWLRVGKDPEKGAIYPQYTPPFGISPAGMRYLMKMGYSNQVFSATIVHLAVKGYIKITEAAGKYTLTRNGSRNTPISEIEKIVLAKLFKNSTTLKLENTNHSKISDAISSLKKNLKQEFEKKYFLLNSKYLIPGIAISVLTLTAAIWGTGDKIPALFILFWVLGWTTGTSVLVFAVIRGWQSALTNKGFILLRDIFGALFITLFSLPFLLGEIAGLFMLGVTMSWVTVILTITIIGVNFLFYYLLKAPTVLGRQVLDQIEGFKMYLEVAEEDRMNLLNPPERTPDLFEKYLPYALALDVENEWARKFADLVESAAHYSPEWYSGSTVGIRNISGFTSQLGSTFSASIASSATAPGSSSGSGGGGSSGGGGGGGGGGGW